MGAAAVVALMASSCKREPLGTASAARSARAAQTAESPPSARVAAIPVTPEPVFTSLPVPGHGDAVVSHPADASGSHPLVIAFHGNYDRPEWICDVWRRVTGASAFVLCPRGSKRPESSDTDPRYTYDSRDAFESELEDARAVFEHTYGNRVDPSRVILVGFSLGGVYAAHVAIAHPDRYRRLVLIEGGDRPWSPRAIRRFEREGGRAVFVCAQPWCEERFGRLKRSFAADCVRSASAPGAGHTYDGRVAEASAEQWSFIAAPVEPQGPTERRNEP